MGHLFFVLLCCSMLLWEIFFLVGFSNCWQTIQRIQYAKAKSDCIAKAEGTYDKKKKQEEKGESLSCLVNSTPFSQSFCAIRYYRSLCFTKIRDFLLRKSFLLILIFKMIVEVWHRSDLCRKITIHGLFLEWKI